MSRLTERQVYLLQLLEDKGQPMSGPDIWMVDRDTSVEGIHMTAASLSRRGLVITHRPGPRHLGMPSSVTYEISVAGKAAIKTLRRAKRSGIKRSDS